MRRSKSEALRFLADARAAYDGRPPISREDVVELKCYGAVSMGASAIRIVALANRRVPFDFQVELQPTGPHPERIVTSPGDALRVVALMNDAQQDFEDLRRLVDCRSGSLATGGVAQLTERGIEVLRIFRLERVNGGFAVAALGTPSATEGEPAE